MTCVGAVLRAQNQAHTASRLCELYLGAGLTLGWNLNLACANTWYFWPELVGTTRSILASLKKNGGAGNRRRISQWKESSRGKAFVSATDLSVSS